MNVKEWRMEESYKFNCYLSSVSGLELEPRHYYVHIIVLVLFYTDSVLKNENGDTQFIGTNVIESKFSRDENGVWFIFVIGLFSKVISLFAGGEKKHDGSLTSPWQHLMVIRAFSILYSQQESTDEINFRMNFDL